MKAVEKGKAKLEYRVQSIADEKTRLDMNIHDAWSPPRPDATSRPDTALRTGATARPEQARGRYDYAA